MHVDKLEKKKHILLILYNACTQQNEKQYRCIVLIFANTNVYYWCISTDQSRTYSSSDMAALWQSPASIFSMWEETTAFNSWYRRRKRALCLTLCRWHSVFCDLARKNITHVSVCYCSEWCNGFPSIDIFVKRELLYYIRETNMSGMEIIRDMSDLP